MKQIFMAELKMHEKIDGAYIQIPFDVEQVFGAKRVKVLVSFDGVPYRGSIVRMLNCYLVGVPQQIRKQIGKSGGDLIKVEIEKDEQERIAELPDTFVRKLEQEPEAKKYYDSLSFTHQKEYAQWLTSAKQEKTLHDRMEKAIEMLRSGKKAR